MVKVEEFWSSSTGRFRGGIDGWSGEAVWKSIRGGSVRGKGGVRRGGWEPLWARGCWLPVVVSKGVAMGREADEGEPEAA